MATIVVDHDSVANMHAKITFKEGMVDPHLIDRGTVSGTFVKGAKAGIVQKLDMALHPRGLLLENRDEITFGTCKFLHHFISNRSLI